MTSENEKERGRKIYSIRADIADILVDTASLLNSINNEWWEEARRQVVAELQPDAQNLQYLLRELSDLEKKKKKMNSDGTE